ncbi:hypothetical protein [Streptomyces ambofaciens]|uniref:hypothetical protein n=1 Tax=Streptomyces ambofaciens TaxID=1889 RepID=UPI000AA6DFCB|nr:hypothetical protein [Streptomyces ambofaciens]
MNNGGSAIHASNSEHADTVHNTAYRNLSYARSPAVGSGTSPFLVGTTDITGAPRDAGALDRGAYAFRAAS